MRLISFAALFASLCCLACAHQPAPARPEPAAVQAPAEPLTFVSIEHGFSLSRPAGGDWQFLSDPSLNTDTLVVPVIAVSRATGAQVVVQIAPAVARPAAFAERLSTSLRVRAGFDVGETFPDPTADGAVGFKFDVGDQVSGRVVVMDGAPGEVIVLLGTRPKNAPPEVGGALDGVIASIRLLPPGAGK